MEFKLPAVDYRHVHRLQQLRFAIVHVQVAMDEFRYDRGHGLAFSALQHNEVRIRSPIVSRRESRSLIN